MKSKLLLTASTLAFLVAGDFALAQASRPAFGDYGLWFTVGFAIVATVSGVIASAFAVSRMLAMLTDMRLVPHSHFGMPGSIQKHTLVYTIAIAICLTVFFDLSRIASLGAFFYITMDIVIHLGVFRHLRHEIKANGFILLLAIAFDVLVLGAFFWIKIQSKATTYQFIHYPYLYHIFNINTLKYILT